MFQFISFNLISLIIFSAGRYSRVTIKFRLKRITVHYIFQTYTPCASITVVSWLSFWMDESATSARTTLGRIILYSKCGVYCNLCIRTAGYAEISQRGQKEKSVKVYQ